MKLIREEITDIEFVTEDTSDNKKNYFIKGVFMQGNIKNRNGRVYPMETLNKEVSRYTKKFINESLRRIRTSRWTNSKFGKSVTHDN